MSCNSLYESADLLIPGQDASGGTAVATYSGGSSATASTWTGAGTIATGTGPGGGFASALDFGPASDYIATAAQSLSGAYTVAAWAQRPTSATSFLVGDAAAFNHFARLSTSSGNHRLAVSSPSTVDFDPATADTAWHLYSWSRRADSLTDAYYDGSLVTANLDAGSNTWTLDQIARRGTTVSADVLVAGVAVWLSELATADHAQINAGFEPVPLTGSLASDGSCSVDSQRLGPAFLSSVISGSNGTVLYDHLAALHDGTVVGSVTGSASASASLDLSGVGGQLVRYYSRLTNSGGADVGDFATRAGGYGSSGDGYYELASATAASSGSPLLPRRVSVPVALPLTLPMR